MPGAVLVALLALGSGQAATDAAIREADALVRAGQLDAALERYKRGIEATAPGSAEQADILAARAIVENRTGDYRAALADALAAAAVYQRLGRPEREARALNLAALANIYAGDYRAAIERLAPAIRLAESAADAEGHAEQLSNLGNAFFFLGRYDESRRAYADARTLAERNADKPWAARRMRLVLLNQAVLEQRVGQYQEALAIYRAEAATVSLPAEELAQALANEGALYRRLGDPAKAMEAYTSASALFAKASHTDGELGTLINRGIVLALDLGDLGAAEAMFDAALARATASGSSREALHARLYRGEAALRGGALSAAAADFAGSAAAAESLQTPEEMWKALYGLGRVAARQGRRDESADLLERAATIIEGLREELRVPATRVDFFQDKREVYDALIDARLGSAPAASIFALMERSRARVWRERLGLTGFVDLAAVQRALDPSTTVLVYWSSSIGSAVLVATRASASVVRLDVRETELRRLASALAEPASDWRPHAAEVSRMLLPAGSLAPDVERVVVVPDGALDVIPFDVLTVEGVPLAMRAAVSYVPAAAMLVRPVGSTSHAVPAPPWRVSLEAFGAPRYAPTDGESPPSLPGSEAEIRAIASEVGGKVRLHLGVDDQRSRLADVLGPRPPLLHLATHGLIFQPIERSRILFSSPTEGGPPGSLFLREAYDLDLRGVELAVLSACDTARGPLTRGEGVESFSRAFLAAGAASTVTTLWRIGDQASIDLMRLFYHHLQQGRRRDDALRLAKLAFLASGDVRAHPHYWAAFLLAGDAGPVSRSLRWRDVAAATLVAAALAAVVWRAATRASTGLP